MSQGDAEYYKLLEEHKQLKRQYESLREANKNLLFSIDRLREELKTTE